MADNKGLRTHFPTVSKSDRAFCFVSTIPEWRQVPIMDAYRT